MRKIDNKQILYSLGVIKEVCKENTSNDGCKTCPFEVEGVCGITDLNPCNWKILDYTKFQALG